MKNKNIDFFLHPFRNWKNFKGKASRSDYWLGFIFIAIAFGTSAYIGELFNNITHSVIGGSIFLVFIIYLLVAFYALLSRRLNDRRTSLWWLTTLPIGILFPIICARYNADLMPLAILVKMAVGITFLILVSTNKN